MMRKSIKNSLNIILAASLLMSCSASNDVPDTLADGSHAVKLDMRVGVSAGVVTGSRELDTWDGAQQVNDMRIYVFRCPEDKKGTLEEAYTYCTPIGTEAAKNGYYTVDAFNNREPYYSAEHQNMPEQHLYTIEPYLQNGYYYQFLAIGRDDKYATTTVLTEPNFTPNETKLEDARIALTEEAKNSAKLGILNTTELFSGILQDEKTHEEAPVLVTEETKYFHRTLTASRNVAGLMIYVENIPAQVESNAAGDVSTVPFTPTSLDIEHIIGYHFVFLILRIGRFLLAIVSEGNDAIFVAPADAEGALYHIVLVGLSRKIIVFLVVFYHGFPSNHFVVGRIVLEALDVVDCDIIGCSILNSSAKSYQPYGIDVVGLGISVVLAYCARRGRGSCTRRSYTGVSAILLGIAIAAA
jgi:hypothetical protein